MDDESLNPSTMLTAIALYSASAKDLNAMDCFLDFHDMRESPKKMQQSVVDLLVSM